jgi:hypothetical protein
MTDVGEVKLCFLLLRHGLIPLTLFVSKPHPSGLVDDHFVLSLFRIAMNVRW